MKEAWFCYERNFAMRWVPVVYHGDRPKNEKLPEWEKPRRSPLYPVPPDCLSTDGSPMFGKLQAIHPAPTEGA